MAKQVILKIYGKVQGVFFRDYTQDQANKSGLAGWVKNMPDGTVEVCLQGEEDAVNKMIEWCREGSPPAKVDKVEIKKDLSLEEALDSFEVRY